ncbi:hypothetical protein [Candidatus Uabimicrobium amorphum]|uniref:hypothetical protein n=1 Tax=Uabimicrobium amorphum TaxID=2596890 RepID=UPI00125F9125|nr:hypothetical protein [Candidatus Uabimicrobium amorphum]
MHLFVDMLATHSPKAHYYRYLNQLLSSVAQKRYREMEKSIEHALRLDPGNTKYLFEKACILMGQGATQSALKILQKIAVSPPGDYIFQRDLARLQIAEIYVYDLQVSEEKKLAVVKKLVRMQNSNIFQQDMVYILKVGRLYAKLGEWKIARQIFDYLFFHKYKVMYRVPFAFEFYKDKLNESDEARVKSYLQQFTFDYSKK